MINIIINRIVFLNIFQIQIDRKDMKSGVHEDDSRSHVILRVKECPVDVRNKFHRIVKLDGSRDTNRTELIGLSDVLWRPRVVLIPAYRSVRGVRSRLPDKFVAVAYWKTCGEY